MTEAPEGFRWQWNDLGSHQTLVPEDDPEPSPCPDTGFGHDGQACVTCLRRRAWARRVAMQADDDGAGWEPADLSVVEDLEQPTILRVMLGKYLIRRGWVTLVHGEFASGKTPLCYIAVVEQVKAGNLAMIVDHEMGQSHAASLLRELGLTPEEIKAGVYFPAQPPPMTSAGRERIRKVVAEYGRDLAVVVIDSLSASMATGAGASDNDSIDVAAWFEDLPVWFTQQFNAAVLVIDHSGVSDGPRPSGSHKKREVPQFHLWVKKVKPFSKAKPEAGRSNIIVMKDRSGDSVIGSTAAVLLTRPGGSFYVTTPEEAKAPGSDGTVDLPLDAQPDDSNYEEVYADLLAAGEEGISKTDLTGRGQRGLYRRRAVDRLLVDGKAVSRPKPGTSNGVLLYADVFAPSQ